MTGMKNAAPTALPEPVRTGMPPLAAGAAGITVLLWASAFVVIREVGTHLSPGPIALLRLAVAVVVLTPLVLARRGDTRLLPRGRSLVRVVIYGLMWFAGYNLALNAGERLVDAGTAALVINLAPLMIAFGAGWFLREGFPRPVVMGSLIAFAGVAIMSWGTTGSAATGSIVGLLLCLLAAGLYAASVLIQKVILRDIDALRATWLGCLVSAIALLPFAPQLVTELTGAPTGAVLGTVYLGVFPTAVAFTTWAYALRRVPAGRLSSVGYLVTVVAVLMSWLLLDEIPTAAVLLGGSICVVGVAVSRFTGARPARPRGDRIGNSPTGRGRNAHTRPPKNTCTAMIWPFWPFDRCGRPADW